MHEHNTSAAKCLIVDDNLINLLALEGMLKRLHFRTATATNGKIAVDIYDESYSIVFMDINMPVMDGIEAIKRIRKIEEANKLRGCTIVVVSAQSENIIKEDLSPLMIHSWCILIISN